MTASSFTPTTWHGDLLQGPPEPPVPVWAVQPFQVDVTKCSRSMLLTSREMEEVPGTSGSGSMQVKSVQRYPAVWEKTRLLLAFPTTYLIEQGFNQVLHMLSKYRICLDLMPWDAVQLKLTSLQPALKKLTGNIKHRAHTNFQSIHIYLPNTINIPII